MSDFFKPRWFEQDFQFTDEQWAKIIKPLGKLSVLPNRQGLGFVARNHGAQRTFPYITPTYKRKRLERISAAAAKLREVIVDNDDDCFDDLDMPKAMFKGNFEGEDGHCRLQRAWFDFVGQLAVLERTSGHLAKYYLGKKAPPANVKAARDTTFAYLVGVYERLTGKAATVTVGTENSKYGKDQKDGSYAGKSIGLFVEFVQAFMSAIPDEKVPTGDEIKWFLDRRKKNRHKKNGERATKKLRRSPLST